MNTFKHLNVRDAKILIDSQKVQIVDIRDAESFNEAHIQGAHHITDDTINEFLQTANHDLPLICYCYKGHSSQSAADFFNNQGFKNVYSIDGGFEEWRQTHV